MFWMGAFLIGIVTLDIDLIINNWSLYRNEDEYAEENKQAPKNMHISCILYEFQRKQNYWGSIHMR